MSDEPFVELTPNVMLDSDLVTGERLSAGEMIRYLPGDFAVKVYGRSWLDPTNIRRHLTPTQLVEYKQYMECFRCRRACAGLCAIDLAGASTSVRSQADGHRSGGD